MSTITIEKYVDGTCVEAMTLPVAPLRFLAGLLPSQTQNALQRRGLDLAALLNDTTAPNPAQWLEVEEGTSAKRVRISRQD